MQNPEITAFGEILLYIIGGIVFILGGLITAWLVRPSRPNVEKLTSYECGEDPTGTAWGQFNTRFYVVALIFILFDVEIAFLFPWATVFGRKALIEGTEGVWGWFSLIEVTLFIGILALGLVYAWAKGFLDWVRPQVEIENYPSSVPPHLYEKLNQRYQAYQTREITAKTVEKTEEKQE